MAGRAFRARPIAPGLLRRPLASLPPVSGDPGGVPLTLTEAGPPGSWPIGLLAPAGRTPWGCLFFSLLGGTFLLWLFSARLASILGLAGLILYWLAYNHPRRASGDAVARTLFLLGERQGRRALASLRPALERSPDEEGLQYLAALVALLEEQPARALAQLAEARPAFARYAEWHHLQARCLRALGRPAEARPAYRRALEFAAYPSRNLLLEEARSFFAEQGDAEGLAALAALAAEALRPGSAAADQAFRSALRGVGEPPPPLG
ncbi:hypothetical protein FJ251_07815 [bacterium]|nr:hypothetical protein [bacterium]